MKKLNLLLMIALVFGISMQVSAVITHRYDFAVDANDVVGDLETVLESGAEIQDGKLVLAGGSPGPRAVLDSTGIGINGYTDGVTLEAWFSAGTLSGWTRVFDFGDSSGNDGGYYLFYTPSGPGNSRLVIATLGFPGWSTGEQFINGPVLEVDTVYHLACIYDPNGGIGSNAALRIVQDGVEYANENVTQLLSDVHNTYAYLGSAVYPNDPELEGSIDEFRIYDKPLTGAEIRFTAFFGPDVAYPIVLRSMSPDDGYESLEPSLPYEFSWVPEPAIAGDVVSYRIYMGTDPNIADPNNQDLSGYTMVVDDTSTSPSYTVAADTLAFKTDYYWRVDTTTSTETYQGVGLMFTTLPDTPYFIYPDPDEVDKVLEIADDTDTASVTVVAGNTDTYRWYKEGDSGTTLSSTDTLTISGASVLHEANYYCEISHSDAPLVIVTSVPIQVLARRLMAYWKLDGDMTDSVDEEIPGAVPHDGFMNAGSPDYASDTGDTGIVGDAMRFSNDAEVLEITDSGDYFNYYPYGFTANLWMREIAPSGWRLPMSKFDIGVSGWLFGLDTNTRNEMVWICDSTGTWVNGNADVDLGDNQWHMITFTYDPSDTTVRLYTDGVNPTEQELDLSIEPLPVAPIFIGGDNAAGTAYAMDGLIDDVKVFSYALSPVEIADLYTATTPEDDFICIEDAENPLDYDVNNDCRVNLADLMELAIQWLECPRVPASACYE